MGQRFGKAQYVPAIQPLLNLDKTSVFQLWEAFNDVAEGFGINVEELTEILRVLQHFLGNVSKNAIVKITEDAFLALDTDENLLVDALEVLVCLCLVSGMSPREKAEFCFTCYDFDESGFITLDELTLLFKSCASGLTKVSGMPVPEEVQLEQYAHDAFRKTGKNDLVKISRSEYMNYVMSNPEVISWMSYYDDCEDYNADPTSEEALYDSDVEDECEHMGIRGGVDLSPLDLILKDIGEGESAEKAALAKAVQSYSRRPWLGTVEHAIPSAQDDLNFNTPDENYLELEWIHGYRAQDVRNNLWYTVSGEIVYMAATVGIVYNIQYNEQRFFLGHSNEIVSLALHPNKSIVATGDAATGELKTPYIMVWESSSTKLLAALSGFHVNAVTQLAFSPNGKLLLSVGLDLDHSCAVYDWKAGTIVFAAKTSRNKVLGSGFRSDSTFVTCGVGHINFWGRDPGTDDSTTSTSMLPFVKKKGVFGKLGKVQTMLSLANFRDGRLITGALSGHIYIWDEGRNLKKIVKAHGGAVNSLYACEHGVISGGKDGKIRLWSPNLEPGASFDLSGVGSLVPVVRSVCWSQDAKRILVGSKASEIFEISAGDGSNIHPSPLIQGHCAFELRGLATHPTKAEYCTVGDDQTLRVWDVVTKSQIKVVRFDAMTRSCTYSPDGTKIIVGLGGKVPHPRAPHGKKDGAFVVLLESDLTIFHEARDSKQWIADVKVSPDGSTLALASKDKYIYLYNMEDFASKGKCKGHSNGLRAIDFSGDNQCLQSACDGFDLMYWNANTGEQHKHSSAMKDTEWYTQNCPFGWNVQGAWPKASKYNGNSELSTVERSFTGTVLATGDTTGKVRLYRYPTVGRILESTGLDKQFNEQPGCNEYSGHSREVAAVRFAVDDSHLISVGQHDRCVFQWKHNVDEMEDEAETYRVEVDSEDEQDLKDGKAAWERSDDQENANCDLFQLPSGNEDADDIIESKEGVNGEEKSKQSTPLRPWLGAIIPPTDPPRESSLEAPDENVTLEWVHGYRAHDARSNVKYLKNGNIVYPAANLGIVLSTRGQGVQRFFTDHSDEVISLAVHPEGVLVATGQAGRNPKVCIWNSDTLEVVKTLEGVHEWAIPILAFSRDGSRLLTSGADESHQFAVYDWANGSLLASCQGGRKKILAMDFTPDGSGLVQAGVDHIKFHQIQGRNIATRTGILGKKGRHQSNLSIGWMGNRPVIGTADGHLYGFQGRTLMQSVKGHEGAVNSLHSCTEGMVSGGKDGVIKLWSAALECKAEFKVAAVSANFPEASIRSVFWNPDENRILVGTRACEIYEINGTDGANVHGQSSGAIVQGHYKNELWGLAVHPFKEECTTVGDDQTVRVWDLGTRRVIRYTKLDTMARACAYSPDGSKIVVGLGAKVGRGRQKRDGAYIVFNERDLAVVHEGRDSKYCISDIKFSPDGSTLALGAHDNKIYLYDVAGGYTVKGVVECHNSFVTHLDFSADGQYLQSNCGAYELMFSDANSGSNIPAISTLKDVVWQTWTCVYGWPVQGLHDTSRNAVGPQNIINTLDRANSGQLVAFGDRFGRVKLQRYPSLTYGKAELSIKGHSANVSNVRFTSTDGFLLTIGAFDRCLFQWKVEEGEHDQAVLAGDSANDSDVQNELTGALVPHDDEGEFIPVKPWVSSVVGPTVTPPEVTAAPDVDLELHFVYGYSSQFMRNNLRYNSAGAAVYFTASIGVIYDKETHSQSFYVGHDDDIVSMAITSDGKYVATGERGKVPRVHVWNALTGRLVKQLRPFHRGPIGLVQFSPEGNHLVSVGSDENHSLAVWRSDTGSWEDGYMQANGMAGQQKVLFARFFEEGERFKIATGGSFHIKFWSLAGRTLQTKSGLFGRKGKVQPLPSAALVAGKLVTGTVSGHLYVWEGVECVKSIKGHEKTISAMHVCQAGLSTGSKDGIVKIWDNKLVPLRTFNMTEANPLPFRHAVRSVCWDSNRGLLLVGTQGSEIYEITVDNQAVLLLNEGHCADELWGLATNPSDPNLIATAGDDCTVRVWDVAQRRVVRKRKVDCMSRAVCWSKDGTRLALGLGGNVGSGRQKKDGACLIIDPKDMSVVHENRDSREWISDVKFSPNGKYFAIASRDAKVYIYDCETGSLHAKCEKHNSYLTHIDFSSDSEYIRSNCGGYELLFFKVTDGSHINAPSILRDIEWDTTTCVLNWEVQSLWPEYNDGVTINACDRSQDGALLACVDNVGQVRVFQAPCFAKEPDCVFGDQVHSSQSQNVRFNASGEYLFSIGRDDRTLCQWKVVRKASKEDAS